MNNVNKIFKLKKAGIRPYKKMHSKFVLQNLFERVNKIIRISEEYRRKELRMMFFVMYDIRSNKVRRLISNFLINKGCYRVQKSIFLAETHIEVYNSIKKTLTNIQEAYDNQDSILVVPINNDLLRSMKIIGKELNIDIMSNNKNTLFF